MAYRRQIFSIFPKVAMGYHHTTDNKGTLPEGVPFWKAVRTKRAQGTFPSWETFCIMLMNEVGNGQKTQAKDLTQRPVLLCRSFFVLPDFGFWSSPYLLIQWPSPYLQVCIYCCSSVHDIFLCFLELLCRWTSLLYWKVVTFNPSMTWISRSGSQPAAGSIADLRYSHINPLVMRETAANLHPEGYSTSMDLIRRTKGL